MLVSNTWIILEVNKISLQNHLISFYDLECDTSCLTCSDAGPDNCKTCIEGQYVKDKECTGMYTLKLDQWEETSRITKTIATYILGLLEKINNYI